MNALSTWTSVTKRDLLRTARHHWSRPDSSRWLERWPSCSWGHPTPDPKTAVLPRGPSNCALNPSYFNAGSSRESIDYVGPHLAVGYQGVGHLDYENLPRHGNYMACQRRCGSSPSGPSDARRTSMPLPTASRRGRHHNAHADTSVVGGVADYVVRFANRSRQAFSSVVT